MSPKKKQFDRDEALRNAMQLFWMKGYTASSVQDILEATDLSRSSLYDTFGDKKSLFMEAMSEYSATIFAEQIDVLEGFGSPIERLGLYFSHLAAERPEESERIKGCMVNNIGVELGPLDEDVSLMVRGLYISLARALEKTIHEAIAANQLMPGLDPSAVANFCLALSQGIASMRRLGTPQSNIEQVVAIARACFGLPAA